MTSHFFIIKMNYTNWIHFVLQNVLENVYIICSDEVLVCEIGGVAVNSLLMGIIKLQLLYHMKVLFSSFQLNCHMLKISIRT